MQFPVIFDVAIGLVVVYFISSLVLSFLMEYIIVRRNWRGDFLYERLKEMFYSSQGGYYNIIEKVYRHPLITKTQQYSYRKPENIDSQTFAKTFVHVLTEVGEETINDKRADINEDQKKSASIENLPQTYKISQAIQNQKYLDGDGKRLVDALFLKNNLFQTNHDLSKDLVSGQIQTNELDDALKNIEDWFISFQLRLDYLFKREVKWYLFIFALILCLVLNIDTLKIYNNLIGDAELRNKMVALGENYSKQEFKDVKTNMDSIITLSLIDLKKGITSELGKDQNTKLTKEELEKVIDKSIYVTTVNLQNSSQKVYGDAYKLIGWTTSEINQLKLCFTDFKDHWVYLVLKILGVVISAFALMFGAPFWHEYLKSMLAVRKIIQPKGFIK